MAIEKPLVTPDQLTAEEADGALEIEIVNPDSVGIETPDGGIVFDFESGSDPMGDVPFDDNLAEYIEDKELSLIANELVSAFKSDKESRSDWEKTYIEGLSLLGLKHEDRTTPWDGACGVFHPVLTEAVIKFQSQSIQELFPASGPVKTAIVGIIDKEKEKQAEFKII